MNPHSLEHVAVWLDDGLSNEKAFPQALDWACRLNLPLRTVIASRRSHGSADRIEKKNPHELTDVGQGPVVEKMNAWGIACSQRGVALEMFMWHGDCAAGMSQFLRPHGLCVCVDDGHSPTQDELLRRSADSRENVVLICAGTCRSISRFLVLCDQPNPNPAYLESVARFCQALEIRPVVLIAAKSEREAHIQQGYAEGVCNSFRLQADFDFVVGFDVRSAVSRVASWRSCSHLIVERRIGGSPRQRLHDAALERFRGLADSLGVLALPESIVLDVPHTFRKEPLSLLSKAHKLWPRRTLNEAIPTEVHHD